VCEDTKNNPGYSSTAGHVKMAEKNGESDKRLKIAPRGETVRTKKPLTTPVSGLRKSGREDLNLRPHVLESAARLSPNCTKAVDLRYFSLDRHFCKSSHSVANSRKKWRYLGSGGTFSGTSFLPSHADPLRPRA